MESYLVSFGPKDQAMVQVWCHGSSGVSEIADGQGASISAKAWPRVMETTIRNPRKRVYPNVISLPPVYEIISRGICTIGCCSGKRPQGKFWCRSIFVGKLFSGNLTVDFVGVAIRLLSLYPLENFVPGAVIGTHPPCQNIFIGI